LTATLAVGAAHATADDSPIPHGGCGICGAWINGYPPNSQWGWFPATAQSADPYAAIEIKDWRAYTRLGERWERIQIHVCTSQSLGPFTVELHEAVGLNDWPHTHSATTRFTLHRSRQPLGHPSCRNVQYRWQPNPGLQTRGIHQMIVYIEYPEDAPPPVAVAYDRPFTLIAETTTYRG
jgi:hypothetical protein